VSRTYAREIQTEAFGHGLEGLLRQRSGSVVGIVNGVDYGTWNPAVDPHIPRNYSVEDVAEGKAANRAHLLEQMGLPATQGGPVLGIVSRLTSQKGFELTFEPLPDALRHLDLRVVVLGTGEGHYEDHFRWLQNTFPQKVCYYCGYSEELAHLIEAGADIFLMPSRFEPCGLNQMYSLKYGTAPIVRRTGGLADTVEHFNPETGEGNGFVFEHYDSTGFAWALKTALLQWRDPEGWAVMRRNGMEKDYSWDKQGAEYEALYGALLGH
jgi:starch synthase